MNRERVECRLSAVDDSCSFNNFSRTRPLAANSPVANPSGKPSTTSRCGASLLWTPLLAISAAAFAVEIPFFFLGMPSGHDVEFHLYSWLEVLSQWRQGVFFPRWASLAQFGYGEPRFLFYPPASWTLGAAISAIFPWTIAASVYIWIALVAAGVTMFFLARRWLDRRDATFVAVFYAVNPYHLVIVYWRSAFAELLASCLLPLLLLLVLKAAEDGRRVVVALALVLAAAWLTNAPAAVMIHYSFALLIVLFALYYRSPRLLLTGAVAILLGACLASFYLLPAIYEQKWVNIGEAVSQGSRPQDNFLFVHTADHDHDAFNRIVTWVALLEMLVIAGTAWAAKAWRQSKPAIWNSLLAWAAGCCVLMFPVSGLLWKLLPKLQFMQFPWRWLLALSLIFCTFVTVGVRRWSMRAAICVLGLVVIGVAWHRIQPPWWDNADDLREMQDNMFTGAGYEGVDEYTPVGTDPAQIDKDARRVTVDGPAHAAIRLIRWSPQLKMFAAEMSTGDQLAVRLFPYPAWKVEVNGQTVEAKSRSGSGQMLVPVQAGLNRVQITFIRTWDRTAGGWISILSGLGIILLASIRKVRRVI
jgi:hypothetical protein